MDSKHFEFLLLKTEEPKFRWYLLSCCFFIPEVIAKIMCFLRL